MNWDRVWGLYVPLIGLVYWVVIIAGVALAKLT
jgi:hypothetical protein